MLRTDVAFVMSPFARFASFGGHSIFGFVLRPADSHSARIQHEYLPEDSPHYALTAVRASGDTVSSASCFALRARIRLEFNCGGAGGDRTRAWGICSPLPYCLATAPTQKNSSDFYRESLEIENVHELVRSLPPVALEPPAWLHSLFPDILPRQSSD